MTPAPSSHGGGILRKVLLQCGVASDSPDPFKLAIGGGPAVIGFPAVDGVLAVASISADPGIPILAGGFTSVAEFMDPLRES